MQGAQTQQLNAAEPAKEDTERRLAEEASEAAVRLIKGAEAAEEELRLSWERECALMAQNKVLQRRVRSA